MNVFLYVFSLNSNAYLQLFILTSTIKNRERDFMSLTIEYSNLYTPKIIELIQSSQAGVHIFNSTPTKNNSVSVK